MGAHHVAGNFLHERFGVEINFSPGGGMQQLQTVEQAGPGPTPIHRPFVATPVGRIEIHEHIHAAHDLVHRGHAPLVIGLKQQDAGQPVGIAPRVPIVDRVLAAVPAHPPKIIAFETGSHDPPIDFKAQPFTQQGVHGIKLLTQQPINPSQGGGGLGGKQVDRGLQVIRQTVAPGLQTQMGGQAP